MKKLLLFLAIALSMAVSYALCEDDPSLLTFEGSNTTDSSNLFLAVPSPATVLLTPRNGSDLPQCFQALADEHRAVLRRASRDTLSRLAQAVENHCEFPE